MNIGTAIGNILKAAVVGGCIYAVVTWQFAKTQDDDVGDFAERACVDEIGARYDASTVRAYSVKKTNNGYIVRASITLPRGTTAKVYCLTNAHGGVKEITIEER